MKKIYLLSFIHSTTVLYPTGKKPTHANESVFTKQTSQQCGTTNQSVFPRKDSLTY